MPDKFNTVTRGGRAKMSPKVRPMKTEVDAGDPRTRSPKSGMPRKPPGANPPKSKPSSEKR